MVVGPWVTVTDAVALAQVSRSALRVWYRNGEVPSRVEEGPHGPQRVVPLDAVTARARRSAPLRRRRERDDTVAELRDRLSSAEVELALLRGRLEALEDQLGGGGTP